MPRLNDQPKAKTSKKPAAAPFASKTSKVQKNPLFESRPKNFGIGKLPGCGTPRLPGSQPSDYHMQARIFSP